MSVSPPDAVAVPLTGVTALTRDEPCLELRWADGLQAVFHLLWLRDNCASRRHPENGQRVRNPVDIPDSLAASVVQLTPTGGLRVVWSDGQESAYDAGWLREHRYPSTTTQPAPALWSGAEPGALPEADYARLRESDTVLHRWLHGFLQRGVAILRGVAPKAGTVREVVALFSYLRSNAWGEEIFDVMPRPDVPLVTATNLALPAHTDDAYFGVGHRVNVLHCLAQASRGGDSVVTDGFQLARLLREQHPEDFELLSACPLLFRYEDRQRIFEHRGPLIELDQFGAVARVRYSNQSVQPFDLPRERMGPYYRAYRRFVNLAHSPAHQLRFRLEAGDLYLLDNYRVLHGRTGFPEGERRHLQACYIGMDALRSKAAVLQRDLGAST